MNEANLTRFGPMKFSQRESARYSGQFNAVEGPAEFVLQDDSASDGEMNVQVKINGKSVSELQQQGQHEWRAPLTLAYDNTIEVDVLAGTPRIRVTQVTQADLGLLCQGYFGLNTSDMERQRAFYDLLGFKGEIYPAGPETSQTFAQSLWLSRRLLDLRFAAQPRRPTHHAVCRYRAIQG